MSHSSVFVQRTHCSHSAHRPNPTVTQKKLHSYPKTESICLTHTHTHTHLSYYHCEDLCLISVSTRKPFFLCYLGGFFLCFVFFGRGKKERKKENAAHTKLEDSVNFHCSPYGESASDALTHSHAHFDRHHGIFSLHY